MTVDLPPLPGRLPPPRSFRTDTVGIFVVLAFSGLAQLLNGDAGAVERATGAAAVVTLWEVTLTLGGALGLAATMMHKNRAVLGLGMELVARIALGFGSFAYAAAIVATRGFAPATFAVLTYVGLSLLMLVGALQIVKWLREQRRAVDEVLAVTRPDETS